MNDGTGRAEREHARIDTERLVAQRDRARAQIATADPITVVLARIETRQREQARQPDALLDFAGIVVT